MRLVSWVLALGLAACSSGPPSLADAPLPAAPPLSPARVPPNVAGRWASSSCGKRSYERFLSLSGEGTFVAEDRVAPCPPGARCIWAGVVFRRGTYTLSADTITLAEEGPRPSHGEPLPVMLSLDAVTRAPTETAPDGKACPYVAIRP